MDQSMMEKFKVIGRCSKMQTVSLDQETKLWDGIPYDINFCQDFSRLDLKGQPITDIPVSVIIEAIESDDVSEPSPVRRPSGEDYRRSQELWEAVDRDEKEERKWEKKQKEKQKKHSKHTKKEAVQRWDDLIEGIMRG